ncbi:MAG: hypothetical protein PHY47_00380 [Lachnospiraceae bacterium]|nr:hypothetical protein [Lachnospiraceae bacterium]
MAKTSIPLYQSTTYSGADTKVFIYRDLVGLKEKIESNKANSKDSTVSMSENTPSNSFSNSQNNLSASSEGTISRGTHNNQSDTYSNKQITNISDESYRKAGAASSSGLNVGANNSGNLGIKGLDSIISELGSLHSLNYSSFREKNAVRTLGRTHARSYTRGQRTIAGTMVFTVLQSHEILNFGNKISNNNYSMLDQVDPFNLLIVFSNEYGSMSAMHLFNVDINTESQSMSIDSLLLNNTMNFYAQDILPVEDIGNVFNSTAEMLDAAFANKSMTTFQNKIKAKSGTGINTINLALSGESRNDKNIQKLLQRSRGLF